MSVSESLWNDECIIAEVDDNLGEADSDARERARRLLRQLRDEMQTRITELEACAENDWLYVRIVDMRDRVASDHNAMIQTICQALGYPVEGEGAETLASLVDVIAGEYARVLAQSLADNDEIVRLTNANDAAQRWLPVEDGTRIDDVDGYYYAKIYGGELSIWEVETDDGWPMMLPDSYALCRLVDAPAPQALDMPDGPGWWAFEGQWKAQDNGNKWTHVFKIEEHNGTLYVAADDDLETRDFLVGKWYRLTMPWEANNE